MSDKTVPVNTDDRDSVSEWTRIAHMSEAVQDALREQSRGVLRYSEREGGTDLMELVEALDVLVSDLGCCVAVGQRAWPIHMFYMALRLDMLQFKSPRCLDRLHGLDQLARVDASGIWLIPDDRENGSRPHYPFVDDPSLKKQLEWLHMIQAP
jgi:hypothetical protein